MGEGHYSNSPWRTAEFGAVKKKLEGSAAKDMLSDEKHAQKNLCESNSESTADRDKKRF